MPKISKKICTTRKTKDHPNVYLVKDLRKKAVKGGHEASFVNKLSKSNLCALLNIDWVGDKKDIPKTTPKKSFAEINIWGKRECGVIKSKKKSQRF